MTSTSTTAAHHKRPVTPDREPAATLGPWAAQRDALLRRGMLGALCCLALLVLSFWPNIRHFAYTWSTDENYSHGFLVPLLSLYFAREASRRGPLPLERGFGLGVTLLCLAMLGRWATILVPVGVVGDVSFLIGLAGLCSLFAGRKALRRYGFAIAFLIFMVPLPIALYTAIASPLQIAVSKVAAALLNLGGIPVLRQGNMMMLPGGLNLFVAEACSGMRQLTGFLALTTAVAWLSGRGWLYRGVLVAAAIPIAMTANVIRVVVTGWIMYRVDPRFALGGYHTAEGLIMMGLGLALLAGLCRLLSWTFDTTGATASAAGTAGVLTGPWASLPGSWSWSSRLVAGGCVLGLGLAGQGGIERMTRTERPLLRQPLASLPLQLGTWVGQDTAVDPRIVREAQADDYVSRVYEDRSRPGRRLTLWMNYSRHGLNLRHSPEICLPSGGWEKLESQTRLIQVRRPGGQTAELTRLAYQQSELVQAIGFWYYIFGEDRLERFVRGLPITSRSSHGRTTRGSGLTVEIFCAGDIDPDGQIIHDFASALLDELEPILPPQRASYRIP